MNKKGFTLIELISAITLLTLILLIAVPAIVNQLGDKKNQISDATKSILFDAADQYMDNKNIIETEDLTTGDNYCVSLDTLAKEKYIKTPIVDVTTGGEISLVKGVKVTINSNLDYDKHELVDKCD